MKTYLVGGAVRDSLLKLPVKDKDWVVVGATPNMLLEKGYQQVGHDFPVFLHPRSHEEYALARTERKSGNGYTDFITWFAPDVTLEQDLQRRDLTINAIAQDENGNYIDPYLGRQDIEKRLLRHVSDAFIDDPLRVLRVARFAAHYAHLRFNIADETMTLMRMMVSRGDLTYLTTERIWKETENALRAHTPHIYFQVLRDCNALAILLPEIDNLFGVPAPAKWHPEIDTGVHTLMSVAIVAQLTVEPDVRFATLCHDVGKALTPQEKWPKHPGHGLAGVQLVKNLCQRINVPNKFRDLAMLAAEFHDVIHTIENHSIKYLIKLFDRIDAWRKPHRINQLVQISKADARGRIGWEQISYPQETYLREAFHIAQSVSTKGIINAGFKGAQIREELTHRRYTAVKNWRRSLYTRKTNIKI